MKNILNNKYILIFLFILIILRYLSLNQVYQSMMRMENLVFPYKILIKIYETGDQCQFYYYSFAFTLPRCSSLETGQEVIISSKQLIKNDNNIFNKKRLTVQNLNKNRIHIYSVKYWIIDRINQCLEQLEGLKQQILLLLGEKEGSIVIGLSTAQANELELSIKEQLRVSGLSYVMNTSQQMSLMLIEVFSVFPLFSSKRVKKFLITLCSLIYLILSGFAPKFIKLSLLHALNLLALVVLDLPFLPFYGLVLAVELTLLIYPWYIQDIGFLLSIAVSLSVIFYRKYLYYTPQKNKTWLFKLILNLKQFIIFLICIFVFTWPFVFLLTQKIYLASIVIGPFFSVVTASLALFSLIYICAFPISIFSSVVRVYLHLNFQVWLSLLTLAAQIPSFSFQVGVKEQLEILVGWYLLLLTVFLIWKRQRKQKYEVI